MFLSIIMPAYNAEKYIARAVRSVCEQSFLDYELIIVNDGSCDGTSQAVEKLKQTYSQIILINQENNGVSSARNRGIDVSKGQYIMFVDADDQLKPDALGFIYERIKQNDIELIVFGYSVVRNSSDGVFKKYVPEGETYSNTIQMKEHMLQIVSQPLFNAIWNKVYCSDLIKQHHIRFKEGLTLGEDVCFNLDVVFACDSYIELRANLYDYFVNDNSAIRQIHLDKYIQLKKVYRYKCIKFDRAGLSSPYVFAYLQSEYERLCVSCIMDLFHKEVRTSKEHRHKFIKSMMQHKDHPYKIKDCYYLTAKKAVVNCVFCLKNSYLLYLFSYLCYRIKNKKTSYLCLDE